MLWRNRTRNTPGSFGGSAILVGFQDVWMHWVREWSPVVGRCGEENMELLNRLNSYSFFNLVDVVTTNHGHRSSPGDENEVIPAEEANKSKNAKGRYLPL